MTSDDRHFWLPLRFRDVDAFGHVYHAEYLTLLDEARSHWFGETLGMDDPSSYVLARVEIDYLSSLVLADEKVRATFAVERVGNSSLTIVESLYAGDGREVSRSRVVTVLRDPATGSSRVLTGTERQRAGQLLSTPE
jgi:acyl-CoA thioester hydrolase